MKLGSHLSNEQKNRISKTLKGRPSLLKGRHLSKETRLKISKANKGRIISKEALEIRSIAMKGRHHSKESKLKISIKNKGKIRSEEAKEKMRLIHKGTHLSEEAKEKLRLFRTGKPLSEKTKRKMSESQKGEKGSNWKGGISSERALVINKYKWKEKAKFIRKKYNHMCYVCGKSPSYDVHHIVPWRETKDDSENNLVLLCKSCHMKSEHNPDYLELKDWT